MSSIRIIEIETKEIYTVEVTEHGSERKALCPVCSADRKKSNQKVLSYNSEKETAYCHHCNASFVKFSQKSQSKKVYVKPPTWNNKTELSDKAVKWFESRGISQNTLQKMRISEGPEWMPQTGKEENTIQFNYFKNNELINVKYRDARKNFKLFKDAELILYNLDAIEGVNECIIVEGEMDALSFIEAGHFNVVSVPNGAGKNTEYLDNYLEYFENKDIIYLATDNDIKGVELRNELSRRLGVEKCRKVDFEQFKDANEYFIHFGRERLGMCLKSAKEFKIQGLFNVSDFEAEYFSLFNNGLQKGYTIGGQIDEFLSFQPGRLYTITGIPNHGKSNWLDNAVIKLSLQYGLKFAYFSPENMPLQLHAATLTEKLIGSKFDNKHSKRSDIEKAYNYLQDNFSFIAPPDKFTIDNILELARIAIKRKGVKGIIIDPYNKIEHQFDGKTTETNYISQLLDKIINFGIKNDVLIFLVAHPRKMNKAANGLHDIPTLYDVNGSANFYNKTDFGITVYRNLENNSVQVYIQKAKFKHLGGIGFVEQRFNLNNGRYSDVNANGETKYDNENWLRPNGQPNEIYFAEVPDIDDDFFNSTFDEPKF